jgi:hypothetical protein
MMRINSMELFITYNTFEPQHPLGKMNTQKYLEKNFIFFRNRPIVNFGESSLLFFQ